MRVSFCGEPVELLAADDDDIARAPLGLENFFFLRAGDDITAALEEEEAEGGGGTVAPSPDCEVAVDAAADDAWSTPDA
jgi:hypothetical protein